MPKKSPKELQNFKNDFQKKTRVNSRAKGSAFERSLARTLNGRFGTKEFCRTPGSGAFATTHTLPEHLSIGGDIITPKNFKFLIECKKGYNRELQISEFFNEKSWITGVLYKILSESKNSNKEPLLIVKQDRKEELAIVKNYIKPNLWSTTTSFIEINLSDDWKWCVLPLNELLKFSDEFFTKQLT